MYRLTLAVNRTVTASRTVKAVSTALSSRFRWLPQTPPTTMRTPTAELHPSPWNASCIRRLSTSSNAGVESPYAAEFSSLLKHLQANDGQLSDEYWQTQVLQGEDKPERWGFLATRLRDSIAVPQSVRPYALTLWEKILSSHNLDPILQAETHTQLAMFFQKHGHASELDSAATHMQLAIDVYQKLLDDGDTNALPPLAAAYLHLALLYQQNRRWQESLQAFEKGVEGQQKVLGQNHGAVADTFQNMGHLHGQLQEFEQAAEAYRKALKIYQNADGEKSPSVAGALHNLGMALQYRMTQLANTDQNLLGKVIEEALESMQTALQIRHAALGSDHVDTAASHMALAQFLVQLKQPDAADEHFEAAAKIWKAFLHPKLSSQGDKSDAKPELSPSQSTTARRHLATVYNNKGATQHQSGKTSEALEDYKLARDALQPLFDKGSEIQPSLMLEWVATHNNIGMAYLTLESPEEALTAHQTAQAILEQSVAQHSALLPHLQPALSQTYGSIGKVYQAQNDFDAALAALEQAHECLKAIHSDQRHPDVAASFNNLGLVHTRLQKYDAALKAYQNAEDLFGRSLGTQHPHTGSCALNTGLTLVQQGKLQQAKEAFGRARDIWAASLGVAHEQTQTAQKYEIDPASSIVDTV